MVFLCICAILVVAVLVLVDILIQKNNPPKVVKKESADENAEYTVSVYRISKRGGFWDSFVFVRSSRNGHYMLKADSLFMWVGIILGILMFCMFVIPVLAGNPLEESFILFISMLPLILFLIYLLIELKALIRAYCTLKRFVKITS